MPARFRQRPVGTYCTHPVVTLEHVKPAFRHPGADDAVGVQTKPRHAFGVGGHMRLAHQPAAHSGSTQMVAQRLLAHFQRCCIPTCAVAVHIAPRIGRHP